MGTMLQDQDPTLEDFQNLEGCNEILNLTRPDIVRSVHDAYFEVGVDCVETNTFGANHTAAADASPARRPTSTPPVTAARAGSWGPSAPAPSCPRSVTSPTARSATATRPTPRACWSAVRTR
jgi:hypothetical protein